MTLKYLNCLHERCVTRTAAAADCVDKQANLEHLHTYSVALPHRSPSTPLPVTPPSLPVLKTSGPDV